MRATQEHCHKPVDDQRKLEVSLGRYKIKSCPPVQSWSENYPPHELDDHATWEPISDAGQPDRSSLQDQKQPILAALERTCERRCNAAPAMNPKRNASSRVAHAVYHVSGMVKISMADGKTILSDFSDINRAYTQMCYWLTAHKSQAVKKHTFLCKDHVAGFMSPILHSIDEVAILEKFGEKNMLRKHELNKLPKQFQQHCKPNYAAQTWFLQ